jgi:hypothetical protein
MGAIFGFLGSLVSSVVGIFSTAAGIVALVVLWKAGAIPPIIGFIGTAFGGFLTFAGAGLSFLGDLLSAVF